MVEKNCFKNNLRMLRIEAQIGQEKLAEDIGVSKGIVSLWENGLKEPGMRSLMKLAKYFKVSIDYLVGLED